jgi:hypothetical protein
MPELPPPLPPGERTVGQLVGETIRAYGANFWRALPLGAPLALIDQASVHASSAAQIVIFYAGGPLIIAGFVWACALIHKVPLSWSAVTVATVVYLPFPLLRSIYILPAVAWFALYGLAVPATLVERLRPRAAFERGLALGRADYSHALGSLAALVIVVGVGEITLTTLLRTQGETSARVALVLADVVLSPLLYLGGAMLYFDQAARVGLPRRGRRTRGGELAGERPGERPAAGSER